MGGSAKFRQAKRVDGKSGNSVYESNYNKERMDKAIWTDKKETVDDAFRKSTGDWWKTLSNEEKKAAVSFTGSLYNSMNHLLGGRLDPTHPSYDKAEKSINDLTSALDKTSIPEDIWVRRGVSENHIKRLFGYSKNQPISELYKNIQAAIDNEFIVDVPNFMSTSGTKSGGFSGVEMKIFVPKGSKGVYAEPFAVHGFGGGMSWDGESKQSNFGYEFEILLQRGYKLKPIGYNSDGGRYKTPQIVFTIVGQDAKPL